MDTRPPGALERARMALVRASGLTERIVDGELVIYDPERQRVHALNSTAAFIWRECDDGLDQSAIVEKLCQRFPESRSAIATDVAGTLEMFSAEGLLVR